MLTTPILKDPYVEQLLKALTLTSHHSRQWQLFTAHSTPPDHRVRHLDVLDVPQEERVSVFPVRKTSASQTSDHQVREES